MRARYLDLTPAQLRRQLEHAAQQAAAIIEAGQREAQITTAAFYAGVMSAETGTGIQTPAIADGIAGFTVDGRPLTAPLAAVAPATFQALQTGRTFDAALAFGAFAAWRIAGTETSDAAWRELLAQMQADDLAAGWTWVSSGRSCGACLGQDNGATRPATQRMAKHPGCDCTASPVAARAQDRIRRPTGRDHFNAMTPAEQSATFKSAGDIKAAAVRDGLVELADMARLETHQAWRATVSEASLEELGLAPTAAG